VSQLDRRQLLRIFGGLAAAGVAGAAAGCTDEPESNAMEQPSGRTIVIGFIAPAAGAFGAIGDEITKGMKLYLAESNNLVGTHRADMRVAEEGASADSAAAAVQSLLKQGVMAIGGVANPAALGVVADAVERARVPLITTTTTASPATFATSQAYTWRAASVQGEAGRAMASYAHSQGRRVFVMHDDSGVSREEANAFAATFRGLGGTVVETSSGKGSFSERLENARSSGANTIFAAFTGNDALELLNAYRGSGLKIKLLGPATLTETADLGKIGTLPRQVYTAGFYAADLDNKANRRFVSSYHKQHGVQPSSFAMAGYDTMAVLDRMLRLVQGDLDSVNLNRTASLLGRIDSPRGPWSFNVNRTPQQKWYLRKLRLDGQVPANLLDTDLAVLS
jgi:branched-chain amino acid transport system substrate-binding protein